MRLSSRCTTSFCRIFSKIKTKYQSKTSTSCKFSTRYINNYSLWNDLGFDKLFSRNLGALGSKKDLLILYQLQKIKKYFKCFKICQKKWNFFYISPWKQRGKCKKTLKYKHYCSII